MNQPNKERRKSLDLGNAVFGKVPPQAKDLEETILGGLMLEDRYDSIAAILKPETFYVTAHQLIYKAIQEIAAKRLMIDLTTVVQQLRDNGNLEEVGGPYYVSKLTNAVTSAANIESHARVITQKFMLREIIRVAGDAVGQAYEDGADAFAVLNDVETEMQAINDHHSFGEMLESSTVIVEALQQIERNRELYKEHGRIPITGVPSGIDDLDLLTLGWQPGDLIIIAARASVGKTAFALKLARSAAKDFKRQYDNRKGKFKKVALFSLEMKASRLMMRIISSETRTPLQELKSGSIEDSQMRSINKGAEILSKQGIVFDDNSGLTVRKLVSKTKKMARKGELGMIVIDYLQLMTAAKGNNREQEIAGISRELKTTAQEYNIPIIALSQLSREVEKRTSGIPVLSDLRESGAIEQDADIVIFIYGPSESAIEQDVNLKNKRYIKIAKQRDGMLDTIELNVDMAIQEFEAMGNAEKALLPGNFRPAPEIRHYNEPQKADDDTPF